MSTTHGVIFVPKGPWFTGDKHETRTCELVCSHDHAFIQAIHVAWKEVVPHVCPPHLSHLSYFPKFVNECWWINISEGKR